MRLVDADELKHEIVGTIPMMATVMIPIEHKIDAAPTIDAIPMWWITEKFLDVLNKDKELSKAVWLVRKAWQKEQEGEHAAD